MRAVLDTNILVDYLNGFDEAASELARYENALISRISWMETLAGAWSSSAEAETLAFLDRFGVVELDERIARLAVSLRSERRIKLPDSIIWATAKAQECFVVTRNKKDFDPSWPDVRIPYEL